MMNSGDLSSDQKEEKKAALETELNKILLESAQLAEKNDALQVSLSENDVKITKLEARIIGTHTITHLHDNKLTSYWARNSAEAYRRNGSVKYRAYSFRWLF